MATLTNANTLPGFCRSSLNMYMYVRGISNQVVNKWQHRQLMNEDFPHIFGKRYFCSEKSNNFLKSQDQTRTSTDL